MDMDPSLAPINGAPPDDGINPKKIWNLLVRNRLLIAAVTGIVAGGTVAYTFWAGWVGSEPVSPLGLLNLLLALVLGLMAGVGVASIRERLDDRVHTGEDLREASGGVTVPRPEPPRPELSRPEPPLHPAVRTW